MAFTEQHREIVLDACMYYMAWSERKQVCKGCKRDSWECESCLRERQALEKLRATIAGE